MIDTLDGSTRRGLHDRALLTLKLPPGRGVKGTALPDSVAAVLKRYARVTGLGPADYAEHSLRSGFMTSVTLANASVPDADLMGELT